MKTTSEEFKSIAESSYGAKYYVKILLNNSEIEDDIEEFVYEGQTNGDGGLELGTACGSKVTFSITEPTVNLANQEITIQQGINVNGTIEYVDIGIFKVLKPTNDRDVYTYECVDRMISRMETAYFSDLSYPTTDIAILEEICTQAGILLVKTNLIPHNIPSAPNGYTKREIISYLAQLQGKNAIINENGNLEFIWYKETDYIVDDEKIYMDGSDEINDENDYVLGYLECNIKNSDATEVTTIKSGNGTTGIAFENPFMTQDILDEVFAKIGGFTYRSAEIEFLGDFRLEVGDIVTVETYGGTYTVPIMSISHSSDGGVITTIKAVAETESESGINLTGPVTRQMNRYYGDLVLINKAMIKKLSVDQADIRYLKADNLETISAEITNLVVENIDGKYADIELANIDIANIGKFFADAGLITSATIVDGKVTGYLDAVKVNANSITAGTLVTDRLVFRGSEKSIVYELNNITGALQAVQSDTLNGEILTDRSITVDKIVAKSITANELNVTTIFSDSAVLKTLFAQNIEATGTITGVTLKGTKGEIGGWAIEDYRLYVENPQISDNVVILNANEANSKYVMMAGTLEYGTETEPYAPYMVGFDGSVYASNITAVGGTIGGYNISETSLSKKVSYASAISITIPEEYAPNVYDGGWSWSGSSGAFNVRAKETILDEDGISFKITSANNIETKLDALGLTVNDTRVMGFSASGAVTFDTISTKSLYASTDLYAEKIYSRSTIEALGSVVLKNTSAYQALTKQRTISDNLFTLNMGCGSTGTEGTIAFELYNTSENTRLARVDIRSDGINYINADGTKKVAFTTDTVSAATNATNIYTTLKNPTAFTTYYFPFFINASSENKSLLTNDGISYGSLQGTTTANGYGILRLGNNIASGASGNKYGALALFGTSSYYTQIRALSSTANRTVNFPDAGGTISIASSDKRLKDNIENTKITDALSVVNSIKIRQFDWKESGKHQNIGFIADELEEIDSHLVLDGTGGYFDELDENGKPLINVKCVDTFYLMGYYGKAIQELSSIEDNHEKRIKELENELIIAKSMIEHLQQQLWAKS